MYMVLLCHGSLVFIKRLWEKLFSTDVGEVIYEHVLTQVGSGGIYVRN